jgi:hypothetical protein
MPPGRPTIIPRIHGKLTRERKMSEPDIYGILEKWLERHPGAGSGKSGSPGAGGR